MRKALLALAVGAFALGSTEFLVMGLLPEMAADLGVSLPSAGRIVAAYALGVVVGAPTLTALAVRVPRKHVLVALMGLFVLGHVLTVLAPSYATVVGGRFLTGLMHGAFFGTAAVVARQVAAPGRGASALATVLTGLTIANVVGIPLGTAMGQSLGWRAAFAVVGALGVVTALAVIAWVPRDQGGATDLRAEVRALLRPQVALTMAITAVGCGGLFAVYTYISPILTDLAGLPVSGVSWALVGYGLGTTAGSITGGRLGDRWPLATTAAGLAVMTALMLAFTVTSGSPVAAVATLVAFGFTAFVIAPPLQARAITAAGGAALMTAAVNQAAFNAANALGAAASAGVLEAGAGLRATMVVGAVLAAGGLVIAGVSWWGERSGRFPVAEDALATAPVGAAPSGASSDAADAAQGPEAIGSRGGPGGPVEDASPSRAGARPSSARSAARRSATPRPTTARSATGLLPQRLRPSRVPRGGPATARPTRAGGRPGRLGVPAVSSLSGLVARGPGSSAATTAGSPLARAGAGGSVAAVRELERRRADDDR